MEKEKRAVPHGNTKGLFRIHFVHIADGFTDDCEELIHRWMKTETLTYETFCEIWKDMKFNYLYHGRSSGAEMAELTEELLHIAKHYMVSNTDNFEESVAGLFIVYALLHLQPYTGFASLRIVPEDTAALARIEQVARRERRYDVLYILGSVLIEGPVQYHAANRERGMETSIRKYLEGTTGIDRVGIRPKGVFYRQNEESDLLRELNNITKRYVEAKKAIGGENSRSLNYTNETLATDLDKSLKELINGIVDEGPEANKKMQDHYTRVQEIKEKAIWQSVNGIKHLESVVDREDEDDSDFEGTQRKGRPKKMRTVHHLQILSHKYKTPPKKTRRKRKRKKSTSSSDDDEDEETCPQPSVDLSPKENTDDSNHEDLDKAEESKKEVKTKDSKQKEPHKKKASISKKCGKKVSKKTVPIKTPRRRKKQTSSLSDEGTGSQASMELPPIEVTDDLNLDAFEKPKVAKDDKQTGISLKINSLPAITRTEQDGRVFEIEIIDELEHEQSEEIQTGEDLDVSVENCEGGSSNTGETSEGPVCRNRSRKRREKEENVRIKKPEKRDQKKTRIKSKFRRMGMLPVANFDDSLKKSKSS